MTAEHASNHKAESIRRQALESFKNYEVTPTLPANKPSSTVSPSYEDFGVKLYTAGWLLEHLRDIKTEDGTQLIGTIHPFDNDEDIEEWKKFRERNFPKDRMMTSYRLLATEVQEDKQQDVIDELKKLSDTPWENILEDELTTLKKAGPYNFILELGENHLPTSAIPLGESDIKVALNYDGLEKVEFSYTPKQLS